ncbi:hypothetical protein E2C01_013148 [Portunus trituberculatus]|uniref:Uncharacterized protein n=1 Tax=Portunus trituberculatus TaxID=210409 RepID=A0A5B7DG87_PORTR|nr:hypothetical protein [Portunus trituberculatus]
MGEQCCAQPSALFQPLLHLTGEPQTTGVSKSSCVTNGWEMVRPQPRSYYCLLFSTGQVHMHYCTLITNLHYINTIPNKRVLNTTRQHIDDYLYIVRERQWLALCCPNLDSYSENPFFCLHCGGQTWARWELSTDSLP